MDWSLVMVFNFILTLCAFILVYLISRKPASKDTESNNTDSLFVLTGGSILSIIYEEPIMICVRVVLGLLVAGIVRTMNENSKKTTKKQKR